MHKQVKLLPGLTITAQFIFTILFGPLGLLLAIPMAVVIQVFVKEIIINDIIEKNIFSKKIVDDKVLNEFEELIISSDAGVDVARELRKDFENFKIDKKLDDHQKILKLIADKMAIKLLKYEKDLSLMGNANSAVIVVSGVNGVGKTTTIGKLGKYFKGNNDFQLSSRPFLSEMHH